MAFAAIVVGLAAVSWVQAGRREIAEERAEEGRRVMRLSAFRAVEELHERAHELWPVHPGLVGDYRAWLAEAERFQRGLEPDPATGELGHRRQRELLRERATGIDAETGRYEFADEEDRWWHGQLTNLIHELESLGEESSGWIEGITPEIGWGIARRLRVAESLAKSLAEGPVVLAAWEEATHALARDERFAGVHLEPTFDLLPLGADPASGLQEFWHRLSGERPRRDATGRVVVGEATGIVLVLVPAGSFWMGTQAEDPAAFRYDPKAEPDEAPVHRVTISEPFFLSKFETTQAQWERLTGSRPSLRGPEVSRVEWNERGALMDLRQPVENVSWLDCTEVARRFGLSLPTEAEWEFAARAGTDRTFWASEDPATLAELANVADAFMDRQTRNAVCEAWNDGYAYHAPVGSFGANPFGLHDVVGNVWEWCRDGFEDREAPYPAQPVVDPCAPYEGRRQRVARGGDYQDTVGFARLSERSGSQAEYRGRGVGVRFSRPLRLPSPAGR